MKTEVVSTIKLDDKQRENVESELKRILGKDLNISYTEDKKILGGLIIKHEDKIINLSLKTKLKEMEKYLED
ncbi:hypothetical protein A2X44_00615 [candidate division CPR3 bacterium GWF2_35_18]|uniref:ATP synthase subunit delta n=1 Tax=candidate division CPR3 bacterium GW2011_GWF2_35_18 TaxID=1618350 RepID=A0A0G0C2C2_UNCC3|nr:MAG: ATP synthase subunit delta [candidate division CPR3 bacterium GW2011_GWF2_35_18]OGB63416.1 MAG: hypothetical protein A2X44_00615 [candidate division CPR3 bacterium GWF2_35_18]OGB64839.1 MAG: hypothetical protein A2250_05415 [candidate division CPR3 bacterium RIFOXYA2_FULL_35_13]OGB75979.1 MAG: hypothetical protein A2476_00980 [candidate division CPR3 bacterium RIFOXYC2_FULL_35_7]OGB78996.1 MAG: hypothetical protein A2296_01605 [candidate division CPR3 bacterium RIFOXYB2_FULL_35_8]